MEPSLSEMRLRTIDASVESRSGGHSESFAEDHAGVCLRASSTTIFTVPTFTLLMRVTPHSHAPLLQAPPYRFAAGLLELSLFLFLSPSGDSLTPLFSPNLWERLR